MKFYPVNRMSNVSVLDLWRYMLARRKNRGKEALRVRIGGLFTKIKFENNVLGDLEDGGNIGGSRIHFPSVPGKYLADLRSRANSQQYSSIYED